MNITPSSIARWIVPIDSVSSVLPYQPHIAMRPRPTAETSNPARACDLHESGVDKALSDRVEVRENLRERNRTVAIGEIDLGVG
jgi:hypothetical protein